MQETVKLIIISNSLKVDDIIFNELSYLQEVEKILVKMDEISVRKTIDTFNPDLLLVAADDYGKPEADWLCKFIEKDEFNFDVVLFTNNSIFQLFRSGDVDLLRDSLISSSLKTNIQQFVRQKYFGKDYEIRLEKEESPFKTKFIAFQTLKGLRIVDKTKIMFFHYKKEENHDRSYWEANLDNGDLIKLKLNTSARDILTHFEVYDFMQLSQSDIVNLSYIDTIELKSRICILHSAFEQKELRISRANLNEIKRKLQMN